MRSHRSTSRLLALGAAALLVLGLAACGDDDDTASDADDTTTTLAPDESGADEGIELADPETPTVIAKDFELTSASVPVGTEVYFANQGSAPHTMTADDGAFDSGQISAGETAEFDAPAEPGEYAFHCEVHPRMTGTLTVVAG